MLLLPKFVITVHVTEFELGHGLLVVRSQISALSYMSTQDMKFHKLIMLNLPAERSDILAITLDNW